MQKIESLKHYSELVKDFKKSFSKSVTNCFYMVKEIEKLTSENRLYYKIYNKIMIILKDEKSYWDLNVIVDENIDLDSLKMSLQFDKDCILNLYSRDKESEKTIKNRQLLQYVIMKLGFQLSNIYRYYGLTLEENIHNLKIQLSKLQTKCSDNGFKIIPFSDKYADCIINLWENTFGITAISIEDKKENIKNSILAVNSDGKLCGVYCPITSGNVYSMWHLAVLPQYRGNGLARTLALSCIEKAANTGYDCVYNWIADDNLPSLSLHKSLGMISTGNITYKFQLNF